MKNKKNKIASIQNALEEYTRTPKRLRRVLDYAKTLFEEFDIPEWFSFEHIKVFNATSTVNITYPDGTSNIIKCKKTKLEYIYEILAEIGVDIDSFDHNKDSIKDLTKFFYKYDNSDVNSALYHWAGESAGFFLNDYVNETTIQSEDICWELQENV